VILQPPPAPRAPRWLRSLAGGGLYCRSDRGRDRHELVELGALVRQPMTKPLSSWRSISAMRAVAARWLYVGCAGNRPIVPKRRLLPERVGAIWAPLGRSGRHPVSIDHQSCRSIAPAAYSQRVQRWPERNGMDLYARAIVSFTDAAAHHDRDRGQSTRGECTAVNSGRVIVS
jgi:hypothetical protein